VQTWLPWDDPTAVAGFLNHFHPAVGVLMETEIWPVLVQACQRRGLALVLANARLNERSWRQAQRLAWLSRPAYAGLTAVWAQTPQDAERLRRLGAPVRGVWGNLKFDAQPDVAQCQLAQQWRQRMGRPVVMLASSRQGEEIEFLKEIRHLSHDLNGKFAIEFGIHAVQWLIVPRHPQRFDEVAALIRAQGWRCERRIEWPASLGHADTAPSGSPSIWLGDSVGEMALYYSLADVALLGGSFEPLGGQNLIEAAACGCPLVMGPHTFNFAEAADLALAAGAAQRVENLAQGLQAALAWALNPAERSAASQAAHDFSKAHQGAADATADAVLAFMAQRASPSPSPSPASD
jgi:3-deoxy-D-manno-octulosonic-acid transferase